MSDTKIQDICQIQRTQRPNAIKFAILKLKDIAKFLFSVRYE